MKKSKLFKIAWNGEKIGWTYYIIPQPDINHDMVEEGVHIVPTLRNRVVIFLLQIQYFVWGPLSTTSTVHIDLLTQ